MTKPPDNSFKVVDDDSTWIISLKNPDSVRHQKPRIKRKSVSDDTLDEIHEPYAKKRKTENLFLC